MRPRSAVPQTYCLLANARKPTFSATASLGRSVPTGNGIPVFEEMARASSTRPRAISHAGDSGSLNQASGNRNTNGRAPMRNSPRHPMESRRTIARTEAMTPPAGTPL